MDAIVDALAEEHAVLEARLSALSDSDWQRPSRCEGWTVADVLLHLVQTDELACASIAGRFEAVGGFARGTDAAEPASSVDVAADRMVESQRGEPGSVLAARWRAGTIELRRSLRGCDPHRRLPWVAGELSARTLATTRLAESWIHGGDIAAALGEQVVPSDRLWHIARLAWRTLPYAFATAGRTLTGPVAFDLRGPDGEPWAFVPEEDPRTVVRGEADQLCLVAARRVAPGDTDLRADGPDAGPVLDLVRTYA
jgi:uncharacterized protein (TIGR03084 family)